MIQFHFGIALILSSIAVAGAQAASVTVQAPCTSGTSGQGGLKSCQEFLIAGTPAMPAPVGAPPSAAIPAKPPVVGSSGQLYQRVHDQILGNPNATPTPGASPVPVLGYYQHVDPDPTNPPGPFFGATVCNLVPGPFNNGTPEGLGAKTPQGLVNNQRGESCGNPVVLSCHGHLSGLSGTVDTTIHKQWNADPAQSQGTLEDGYAHGGLVAATTCYYQQVTNEIQNNRQLTISDMGGHPSPCAALQLSLSGLSQQVAADVQNVQAQLGAQTNSQIQTLQGQLTSQANLADIANCAKGWDTSSSSSIGSAPDKGPLRQSAQQLCAHRDALETMFVQLAACEIFARAQYSYLKQIGSPSGQQAIANMLINSVSQPCANSCKAQLNPSIINIPSDSTISNCANACYIQQMPGAFQNYLKNLWPGDGSGQCDPLTRNDTPVSGVFMVGMIGLVRRRKKAVGATIGPVGICALSAGLFLASGCGGAGSSPPTYDSGCANNSGPAPSEPCGCSQSGPSQGPSGSCSNPVPGGGAIKGALAGGAAAANTGILASNSAKKLTNPAGQNLDTGAPLAQGQAAAAGGLLSGPGNGQSASGNGGGGTGSGPGAGTQSTGSGAVGGPGGSIGLMGGLSTAAMSGDGAADPAGASGDSSAGLYKSGGAGTGAVDGGGARFPGSGMDIGIDGAGGPSETRLGADANGADGKTMGSEDPADYFTRLGLEDNIFKVVERRYRQKSMNWAMDTLSKPGAPAGVNAPALAPKKPSP